MLLPSVKLLVKFDDDTLYDNVSTNFLEVKGTNHNVDILDNGLGYIMKQDQYLLDDACSLDLNSTMMIGFWLYPVNPGVVLDPVSGAMDSIEMPIITITEQNNIGYRFIKIYESTTEDDENFLTISLNNNNYSISSENYSTNIWHYVWIVFNGIDTSTRMDIYIDGTLNIPINELGELPITLNSGSNDIYINYHTDGYAYNKTNNYGYIDDIVIFNIEKEAEEKLQRIINYSIDYVVDDNYQDIFEKDYGILYIDPSTIRINSIIDDMSFIYLARNDGKILRGSPLFWEVRKVFSDLREIDLLKRNEAIVIKEDVQFSTGYTGPSIEEKDGFLKITNSTVRL